MDYEYRAHDGSLLGPVIRRHICQPLLPYIPRNVSANALTFTGHVGVVLGFLWILAINRGPLTAWSESGWPYLVPAAALALFLITDDVDGLQARRLGVSGPLGDFIDHWLDSLAGFLVPLTAFIAYGATPSLAVAFVVACGLAWWTGTALRWKTGELRLPRLSEVELNALMLLVHLVAVVGGPRLWQYRVSGLTLIDGIAWFCFISAAVVTVSAVTRGGPERRSMPGLAASLLPPLVWYGIIASAAPAMAGSALVTLLFGMTISAHVGELLRRCLIGTRERPYDPVLICIGAALLSSGLVPALRNTGTAETAAAIAVAAAGLRLAYQFTETVTYIMNRRGDRLFATPGNAPDLV